MDTNTEIRDLLAEIRDLLKPVADAYQDEYERREAEREADRLREVQEFISTEKRRKAWQLADGSRSLTQIAKASGMAKGNASTFFKKLRELGAITTDTPNPERTLDLP